MQCHENPSSGIVLCGQTNRQTDMMELTVAFRNFANAPKNETRVSATLCPLALL
jgi:hypothetical protein